MTKEKTGGKTQTTGAKMSEFSKNVLYPQRKFWKPYDDDKHENR
jgi:hypothetical protein